MCLLKHIFKRDALQLFNRVKDVMANMFKMRGKRGAREVSDEKYEKMLKEKFELVMGSTPEWAQLDRKIEKDSDDEGDFNRV